MGFGCFGRQSHGRQDLLIVSSFLIRAIRRSGLLQRGHLVSIERSPEQLAP
jgi:hypothetical protein